MDRKNLAAIDLGTNSCRIMITDAKGNVLFRDAVNTKLGEGMYERSSFTPEAIRRGLECLSRFAELLKSYEVGKYRAIATEACRAAKNGSDFVEQAAKTTGIKLDVISPEEEAILNLRGAMLNATGNCEYLLVYDLGGGSTEITLAANKYPAEILYTLSVPWGARTAAEAFNLETYDEAAAQRLRSEIEQYTRRFLAESGFSFRCRYCCLATSSTPLRLWSMLQNTGVYDKFFADGQIIITQQLDKLINKIHAMTMTELLNSPYISKNRASIFNAACVIFQTVYQELRVKEITASLKGAQEAVIQDLETGSGKAYTIG